MQNINIFQENRKKSLYRLFFSCRRGIVFSHSCWTNVCRNSRNKSFYNQKRRIFPRILELYCLIGFYYIKKYHAKVKIILLRVLNCNSRIMVLVIFLLIFPHLSFGSIHGKFIIHCQTCVKWPKNSGHCWQVVVLLSV